MWFCSPARKKGHRPGVSGSLHGCTRPGNSGPSFLHSYLATTHKWGKDKYQILTELFTTGPWLPPALVHS